MPCLHCSRTAVISLQHGDLCKNHFIHYFEEKVFKTIKQYQLISRHDKLCVATSGGKDSLTVLYLTKKFLQENDYQDTPLFALAIDEGIKNYRAKTLKDLKSFCKKQKVELTIIKNKEEFGYTLDQAHTQLKSENKKPCNICGVWRRYLLNKHAKALGATKVITGHNLDDEAQVILMNIFKANTSLAASIGPIAGIQEQEQFAQRVKPLYFCSEKETRLYSLLKGFKIKFTECPYAKEGYRSHVQDMLNEFESKYKGTKQGIINSFLHILPLLKEKEKQISQKAITPCKVCTQPSRDGFCNACKIVESLKNGKR